VVSAKLWLVVHREVARTARVRAVMAFLVTSCLRWFERSGLTRCAKKSVHARLPHIDLAQESNFLVAV
jgi:hypothetical protein